MQFALVSILFALGVYAKNGFPDGPDCVSLGKGSDGLEIFRDNDGCCLLPARCGNEAGVNCRRENEGPNGLPINTKRVNFKIRHTKHDDSDAYPRIRDRPLYYKQLTGWTSLSSLHKLKDCVDNLFSRSSEKRTTRLLNYDYPVDRPYSCIRLLSRSGHNTISPTHNVTSLVVFMSEETVLVVARVFG
ncbi:unnamed protein product [Fusarium venenatum]|uniref:Uncharacterized protein n=1 Tax=Fusarium venenatum TaxID=56646 RepID=A0A2L2U5N6_9HYPO|nr:uncharacterized protein FVRRES_10982 [Fusarium venenatum]CEI70905.1 unnamed protein product [Fusarium venenatum]